MFNTEKPLATKENMSNVILNSLSLFDIAAEVVVDCGAW